MSKRTPAAAASVPPIPLQAAIPIAEGPISFDAFKRDLSKLSKELQNKGDKDATLPSPDTLKLQDLSVEEDEADEADDDGRALLVRTWHATRGLSERRAHARH